MTNANTLLNNGWIIYNNEFGSSATYIQLSNVSTISLAVNIGDRWLSLKMNNGDIIDLPPEYYDILISSYGELNG